MRLSPPPATPGAPGESVGKALPVAGVTSGLTKAPLANDFGAKVIAAWLRRCGYTLKGVATSFDAAAVSYTHAFSLA